MTTKKPAYQQPDKDFADVWNFFATRTFLPALSAEEKNTLKRLHRAIYSIVLWSHFVKHPEHGQVFLNEAASDAIQVLPSVLLGLQKSSMLLTRGIIENILRHVYFADHRIEFQRMNAKAAWFITPEELFEYAREHPVLQKAEKEFDSLGRLRGLYRQLSANVHGGRLVDLRLHKAIKEIQFSGADLEHAHTMVKKTAESVNVVLFLFNEDKANRIPMQLRRFILLSMPKNARKICSGLV